MSISLFPLVAVLALTGGPVRAGSGSSAPFPAVAPIQTPVPSSPGIPSPGMPMPGMPAYPMSSEADKDPGVVEDCLVTLINDVNVPADLDVQQGGGVLTELKTPGLGPDGRPVLLAGGQPEMVKVTEGLQVVQGQVLGQIDLQTAQAQREAAQARLDAAKKEAENDVNVRYGRAAAAVAQVDYQSALETNQKVPGTIPAIEVRGLGLKWEQARLQTEQAEHEFAVAKINVKVRDAELRVTDLDVQRRQIKVPIDGVIVELFVEEGEWLRSGDPIVRIVRMDTLRVEGSLDFTRITPGDVDGRNVTVTVKVKGQPQDFVGKVVFASPIVEPGGRFRVRAEVENQKIGGHWQLRPGMPATMTIHWR